MSGASRVSIPNNLKKTIQDIKEIAGKHSDEDIYAMLKECSMDPNETAQQLLYLDTFHEVKSKRDRRKMSVNSKAYDGHQRTPGMQRKGNRGGRQNYSSNSDGVGAGRQVNAGQENGYKSRTERASRSSAPGPRKTENNESSLAANSTSSASSSASIFNGSSSDKSTSQFSGRDVGGSTKDSKAAGNTKFGKMPFLQSVAVKKSPNLNPGPTPTSTPTRASTAATGATFEGGKSKSISNHLGNSASSTSVSGLYSSASDPLLVPSLNPQKSGRMGTIKPETGKQQLSAQVSTNSPADDRISAGRKVTKALAVSASIESISNTQPGGSQGVDRSELAEATQMATIHNVLPASKTTQETPPVQGTNEPSKDGYASKQVTSEVDTELHKSSISTRRSVIFPDHIHVPEAFKTGLTFGSLNMSLGQNDMESKVVDVEFATNVEAVHGSSVVDQPASSIPGRDDYPDCPQSPPHVSDDVTPAQENVSTAADRTYDQAKQELLQPVGGSQNSLDPAMMAYSLSLVPSSMGTRLVQAEVLEPQGVKSVVTSTTGSAPSVTQPAGISQNSIAVNPQLFPYLRQPYPNYIPYNPYFSQLYMTPPNAPQFLGNGAFPQQPSTGNIYMPPTPAAAGVKYPVPSLCKPGTVVGNVTHFGTGYGSYGASSISYSPSAALAPGNSANSDIVGSELKEKTIYSSIKQNEDSHAWTSVPGRDMSTLQANVFYNLPQGQHSVFHSQVGHGTFPGIYHPTQTMPAPSTLQSLSQQSQAVAGPLSAYPQPQLQPQQQAQHAQINWNPKLVN